MKIWQSIKKKSTNQINSYHILKLKNSNPEKRIYIKNMTSLEKNTPKTLLKRKKVEIGIKKQSTSTTKKKLCRGNFYIGADHTNDRVKH